MKEGKKKEGEAEGLKEVTDVEGRDGLRSIFRTLGSQRLLPAS